MGKRNLLKDALRTIKAMEDINVAYRIGGRPKESSLDWLSSHKDRVIAELQAGEEGKGVEGLRLVLKKACAVVYDWREESQNPAKFAKLLEALEDACVDALPGGNAGVTDLEPSEAEGRCAPGESALEAAAAAYVEAERAFHDCSRLPGWKRTQVPLDAAWGALCEAVDGRAPRPTEGKKGPDLVESLPWLRDDFQRLNALHPWPTPEHDALVRIFMLLKGENKAGKDLAPDLPDLGAPPAPAGTADCERHGEFQAADGCQACMEEAQPEEFAWEPHARALKEYMERKGIKAVCLGPRWEAGFHDLHDPEGKDSE